jgi:hypothetical protein
MVLRPGFEPGSRDRESLMLGRTTIGKSARYILQSSTGAVIPVRSASAPSNIVNKAFSFNLIVVKAYSHCLFFYALNRFVKEIQLSSRRLSRLLNTSCAHPVAWRMTAMTIETVTTASPSRRLSSTSGPPLSLDTRFVSSSVIISPCPSVVCNTILTPLDFFTQVSLIGLLVR